MVKSLPRYVVLRLPANGGASAVVFENGSLDAAIKAGSQAKSTNTNDEILVFERVGMISRTVVLEFTQEAGTPSLSMAAPDPASGDSQ
jgi:hypothetical protein